MNANQYVDYYKKCQGTNQIQKITHWGTRVIKLNTKNHKAPMSEAYESLVGYFRHYYSSAIMEHSNLWNAHATLQRVYTSHADYDAQAQKLCRKNYTIRFEYNGKLYRLSLIGRKHVITANRRVVQIINNEDDLFKFIANN